MSAQRGKRQTRGPLEGHFKDGRIFRPPLLAYEATRAADWVRDDLPDLLWPLLLCAKLGDPAATRFRRVQELVIEALDGDELDRNQVSFDGRLTSIESVPPAMRRTLVSRFAESSIATSAIPPEVRAVLSIYDGPPGAWLLLEPFRNADDPVTPDEAASILLRAMVDAVRDDHLNALVKCAPLGWLLLRGRLTMDPKMVEVLRDYPGNLESRPLADSMIRSSFGAMKGAEESRNPERPAQVRAWARSFWTQNWHMFACLPEERPASRPSGHDEAQEAVDDGEDTPEDQAPHHFEQEPQVSTATQGEEPAGADLASISHQAVEDVIKMFNAFLDVALDHERAVDLHAPAKHEVICGLVSRAARLVLATVRAPHLWSGEHGMSTLRALSETTIVLSWMSIQHPSIYERFQNYGRGKAKLMKEHMDSLARSFPGDPPPELTEAIEHMSKKLGGDWGQEFQEVNLESTFSGLTVRQMAIEAGLEDEYRYIYQSSSGTSHGEWWAIEDYATQRCLNPLHLFHRIPSFEAEFPSTAAFGQFLVRRLSDLIALALRILFPPPEASAEGEQRDA